MILSLQDDCSVFEVESEDAKCTEVLLLDVQSYIVRLVHFKYFEIRVITLQMLSTTIRTKLKYLMLDMCLFWNLHKIV